MSGKVTTGGGLLKPAITVTHRSSSAHSRSDFKRTHSKERPQRTSFSGSIAPFNDGNSNISVTTSTHTTLTNNAGTTNASATTTTSSSKLTSPSTNNNSNTITCSPTIIKTPAPPTTTNRNTTGSPLLRSASPHTRSVANSTASSSSTPRSGSTNSTGSNNQTRTSASTTTTHLSPWVGPTTYTSNGNNKKTSATADSRLVVLGSPAVGKSALVVRLLTGRFIWEYDPTLEAAYRHHTTVDDDSAVLDILDTAGQIEGLVNEAHARWGDGFALTFSLTDRRSFNAIKEIHDAVASARQSPNFSCIIIANKTDLGHLAEVSEDEASDVAGELGASLFLTSACDGGPAIQAAFSELHRDVIRRRWTRRRRSSAKTVIEGFYKMFSR